jgi:hypothetical protein
MRFHGLMLLRDEQDVIAQCFDHLLTWIDSLHIYDLGSTDATWDIVQDYARRDKRIIPVVHQPTVYNDNLRCYLFHRSRQTFDPGDWCLKIDADEFYHVTPPDFVRTRLAPGDSAVHLQWYFFRLTKTEVADYESGKVDVHADRKRSITDRRRYYKISQYAEPRMFRYRRAMQWPENISFPYNAGFVSKHRIPIRHYPHRDNLQLLTRFRLRAQMMQLNAHAGSHWKLEDWRKELVDDTGTAESAALKQGIGGENGIDTGPLLHWAPNTPLPEQPLHNHVPPIKKRIVQRLIHPALLPLLDSRRPHYNPSFQPVLIDPAKNKAIGDYCRSTT